MNKEVIKMETKQKKAVIQVRIDETVKRQAVAVLNNLGMDASTAINVFLDKSLQKTVFHFNQNKPNLMPKPLQPLRNLTTWSKMELANSILLLTKCLKKF